MRRLWLALALALAPGLLLAQAPPPGLIVDDMENLAAWRTGGQKEAALSAEKTIVHQGQQALRFDVRIDHQADESIEGKQYPKGWPRLERNPQPTLDLSDVGGLEFWIYTLSSRSTMPGNSLNLILRDQHGGSWSANLGELPLKQWKHFRLDFPGDFDRRAVCHWQFYLSEADYRDRDQVSFIIDDVRGYPAQQSRQLLPRLQAKLAALTALDRAAAPELRAAVTAAAARLSQVDQLPLAESAAFDRECAALLPRLSQALLTAGAARTVPGGAYCVGIESSLRKVHRDELDFTPGRDLRLSLAGNERESAQVLVHPLTQDLPRLNAEWTDLTGPGGAKLARDRVSVSAVGYVEMLKANYSRDRDGWWPDPLLPLAWPGSGQAGLGPLSSAFAHVGETQPLWVTVACPAGQRPGRYTGTLTLQPAGATPTTVSLTVTVRAFSLPTRPRLKTAFAFFEGEYRGYYGHPLTDAQRQAAEAFLLAHRLNPMNLYTPWAWPPPGDVTALARQGLNAYCLGYCPGTVADFGAQAYYYYLRDYLGWLRKRGLAGDAWLYGYDEPHCRPDWEQLKGVMREVYALVDAVAPGLPKASTTAIVPELNGAVNLWIPQTMQVARPDTLARQRAGDQVWTYVACTPPHPYANYFIEYAALEQRLLGWQTWQEHCTGFLYYATNLWRPNYEGLQQRWPALPWNPRPDKNFAFNGDGLLIYPHPDGSLLSTVRLEAIGDGFEDYDYLCLLRDATAALHRTGKRADLVAQAEAATVVPAAVSRTLTEYGHDPAVLLAQRAKVATVLEQVKAALPAVTWQQVLTTEPRLNPVSPAGSPERVCDLPYDGRSGPTGLVSFTSGQHSGATGQWAREGGRLLAQASGTGRGWADWETPLLRVKAPQDCVVRLAVRGQVRAGLVRVYVCKYGADGLPLDLPTRAQGAYAPSLVATLTPGGDWEKHRYVIGVPAGVATVRVRLQAFGLDGTVTWDGLSVAPYQPDPNQVDDCDEAAGWRPGFPEASVARETQRVRQGDAALRFTVKVDHQGGEAKYPKGWPSLTRELLPRPNWTGKQALTFWVYATSSRAELPRRALNFTLTSEGGDSLSQPLTFPLGEWVQVKLPLAGKKLEAVSRLHFFVEEAVYEDKDEVSFVLDDLRVE